MNKTKRGVLSVLLVILVLLLAAGYFRKDEQMSGTRHYPDKGSYTYYLTPPESPEIVQQPSGIYFYD